MTFDEHMESIARNLDALKQRRAERKSREQTELREATGRAIEALLRKLRPIKDPEE